VVGGLDEQMTALLVGTGQVHYLVVSSSLYYHIVDTAVVVASHTDHGHIQHVSVFHLLFLHIHFVGALLKFHVLLFAITIMFKKAILINTSRVNIIRISSFILQHKYGKCITDNL
jgi:hypothetical protein